METLRLALVALLLLLPFGALYWGSVPAHGAIAQLDTRMPRDLGDWRAVRDGDLNMASLDMLAPAAYAMRLYAADGAPQVWAYVAIYSGGVGRADAHDPQVCYPAQGWSITEQRVLEIDVGERGTFPVHFLRNELAGAEELVLYWFQPTGRWPRSRSQENFMRVVDALLGRPGYAFIRLSYRRPQVRSGVSEADLEPLLSIATEIAPWIRAAVSAPSGEIGAAVDAAERRPRTRL